MTPSVGVGCCPKPGSFALVVDDAIVCSSYQPEAVGLLLVLPTFTLLSEVTPAICEKQALDRVGGAIRQ
jgi:hypothetical protein